MKKIISIVALMLFTCAMAFAQDGKKNVAVEEFTYNTSIGTNWVENLRNNIIGGITKTSRVNVVDAKNLTSLPSDKEARLVALGEIVDVILNCHFNSMTTGKNKEEYTCKASFTITLTDAKGGAVISTTPFEESWYTGDTQAEAITNCLNEVTSHMKKFIDDNFKSEAIVKQLDQVDDKKGVKTAYISIGSNAGITVGQMFDIMEEVEIAGEKASKKIGDAKAQEVVSGTLTLVKITKGGVEIKKAFDAGHNLIVVTRAKKDPFGLGDLLE
jgi:hypothetical protein